MSAPALVPNKDTILSQFAWEEDSSVREIEAGSSHVYKIKKDGSPYALKVFKADEEFTRNGETLGLLFRGSMHVLSTEMLVAYDLKTHAYEVLTEIPIADRDMTDIRIIAAVYPWMGCQFFDEEVRDMFDYYDAYRRKADGDSTQIDRHFLERLPKLCPKIITGIAEMHSRDISHLDIKPDNILLSGSFADLDSIQVRLGDLGYASECRCDKTMTERKGTTGYVAPEILKGQEYDPKKADIYSLGITLLNVHDHPVQCDLPRGSRADVIVRKYKDARGVQLQKLSRPSREYSARAYAYLSFIGKLCKICTEEYPNRRPDADLVAFIYQNRDNALLRNEIFSIISKNVLDCGKAPSLSEVQAALSAETSDPLVAAASRK